MNKLAGVTSTLLLPIILMMTGCNEESGAGQLNFDDGDVTSISELVRVYDYSVDYGSGIIDEFYVGIDANGVITAYDYQGDSSDQGLNCYEIYVYGSVSHVSGSTFSDAFGREYTYAFEDDYLVSTDLVNGDVDKLKVTSLVASDLEAAECD